MLLLLVACAASDSGEPAKDTSTDASWATPFAWAPTTPVPCPATVPDDDLVASVLAARDLDLTVGIHQDVFDAFGGAIASDPARRSWFHPLMEDLPSLPCTGQQVARRATDALSSDHPLTTLVADAAWMLDAPLTVGGPLETPSLSDALAALGGDGDVSAVPAEIADLAAILLATVPGARDSRDAAMEAINGGDRLASVYRKLPNSYLPSTEDGLEPADPDDLALLAPDPAALATLFQGATRITQAMDERLFSTVSTTTSFSVRIPTDLGLVVLSGGGDDTYDPVDDPELDTPILLVLDAGGDDVWRIPAGATADEDHPVGLAVDLGGDDLYGYVEVETPYDMDGLPPADADGRYAGDESYGPLSKSQTLRQGAGALGYGLLVDVGGGRDVYRTLRFGQGFGALGVGLAYDDGGDDSWEAEACAQGAGLAGIGLLVDAGGDDLHRAFSEAQGIGFPDGAGFVVDGGGNDTYDLIVDAPKLYPWYDGWTTNLSLGQGTSYGHRDSTSADAVQLAGGLGLLADAAGDDVYRAAVMAQGHGYWMGLGVLADAAGNDHYDGVNYVQGAAEHFALAAFLEGGGDDVYQGDLTPVSSSVGLGHDYSIGVFVELGGNDDYIGPDRSLGAGKCHGFGLFADTGGNDHYEALDDRAIGWATDWDYAVDTCGTDTTIPTWGFFVDGGGSDIYVKPDPTGYGDDRTWLTDDPSDPDAPLELSAGMDADGASFLDALN